MHNDWKGVHLSKLYHVRTPIRRLKAEVGLPLKHPLSVSVPHTQTQINETRTHTLQLVHTR
jgi:hypothetical protein